MNTDWLDNLMEETSETHDSSLAETDPTAWLLKQVEEDTDHFFTQEAPNRFTAMAQKESALAQVEVTLDDEGFVRVKATARTKVDSETEIPFRMYQMARGSRLKTMGYLPATAGEPVTFCAVMRPSNDLDLSTVVSHCIDTITRHASIFEKIRNGKTVKDVFDQETRKIFSTARQLHELLH